MVILLIMSYRYIYCSYGRDHILSASQMMITAYGMTGVDHHGHEGRKKGIVY